jgi:hypothetical protein
MLNYKDLSPAKRKWVDLVEYFFPDIKERGVITFKELNEIHAFLKEKRKEDIRYRVAKPLWLIMANATGRGIYKFPATEKNEDVVDIDPALEPYYQTSLEKYGIPSKDYF